MYRFTPLLLTLSLLLVTSCSLFKELNLTSDDVTRITSETFDADYDMVYYSTPPLPQAKQ